jgi:hypothetical protein
MATEQTGRGGTQEGARKSWVKPLVIGVVGLLLLVTVPALVNVVRSNQLRGQEFPSQGNTHIEEINVDHPPYNSTPPTSGWHVGRIADWGSYDFVVPDELLIHNMEDGGVILWYQLGTSEENQAHINRLEEAARGFERVVIAPREDLETAYAITAWQRLDTFNEDDFSSERIHAFLEAYEGIDHHAG